MQFDFFHHLSDDAVCKDYYRRAVFECQFEAPVDEVVHVLGRGRCDDDIMIVAVSASFYDLVVIALARLDGTKPWSTSHYIDYNARQFSSGHVAYAFAHQADSWAAG